MKLLILALFSLTAISANAVVTKDCPDKILVVYAEPLVISAMQYEMDRAMPEGSSVGGELELMSKSNGQCDYRPTEDSEDKRIYRVRLEGTFRKGSSNPAVLIAHISFGRNYRHASDIRVYHSLESLSTDGIEVKGVARLNVMMERCYYGCVSYPERVGEFEQYLYE
ncbi:MAG: hypothetical protein HRT45_10965 [Bdellovibrionales bacterium]|nr:hypothetical protein [Bdellovibrionales bacterium]